MPTLVSKCGIDCSACPWGPYPRKGMTTGEFERYKNHAKRILGFMPIQTPCVTCQTPDSKIPKESKLPNKKCLIRRCVDKAAVANCAYCARFPCNTLKATAGAWNRENIEARLGAPISEEEYNSFVKPFEGIKRLEAIRASLSPEEIVEPAKISTSKANIADFPQNLPFPEEEIASFKAAYELLIALRNSSLGFSETDTFAQQHKLENLRAHVLRFLWIIASYGKVDKENGTHLVVDPETYFANRGSEKTLATWTFVQDTIFKLLSEFGICCERVALKGVNEQDLTTGTGYLRYKGWVMRMSFEEKIGGNATLKALQTYTKRLDEKYGKKAFKQFSNADMQVLTNRKV